MKNKNSGITANDPARPEFMNGDICRDKYGGIVTVEGVTKRRITYRREGYEYDYVMPVYQFRRDFSLVQTAPHNKPTSRERARANIQEIGKILNVLRGKR